VAFSPDGQTLASASADKTLRLWSVRTHHQLGTPLTGHKSYVYGVAFSRDGQTLATASDDTTVRLWDGLVWRNFAELQGEVCKLVGTGLSRSEWRTVAAGISYRNSCP
jgi:WD40 repeat protein